jgi:hypothetical protein
MSALVTTKSSLAPAPSPHQLLPHWHIHTLLAAVFTPSSIGIGNHKSYRQQQTDIIFNPEPAEFFHLPSPIIGTICIGYQHPPIDLAQQPPYCRLVLLNHLDSYPKMVSTPILRRRRTFLSTQIFQAFPLHPSSLSSGQTLWTPSGKFSLPNRLITDLRWFYMTYVGISIKYFLIRNSSICHFF